MTRRDRHINIIEMYGWDHVRQWILPGLAIDRGFSIYSDDALEELAALTVADRRFHRKIRRQLIEARERQEAAQ